ncbi:MAG: molybdopterin molybdenumtransferase MoeA [Gammaproteobacteria bacterium]|nr:molybdopterin molybdenumtransferase MoeA [Gammaproteobacteria bacterium]
MSSRMSSARLDVQPSCDDDYDPNSLTCAEARLRIAAHVKPLLAAESVPVRDALGRVLASPVVSRIDVPGHLNSAMDGYAIVATDLPAEGVRELTVIGSSFAGKPFYGTLVPGQAVRIMTGAVVPEGADTILLQELVEARGDRIRIDGRHQPRQHLRAIGEDIARGQTILTAGQRITPAELGLIASLGITELKVLRKPRVAFFSTGDELRSLGEPLGIGEIYDSNRYTLFGMLTRLGVEIADLGVVADDPDALQAAFVSASADADVVITSGGVSVGEADYTKEILSRLGEVKFWKVAMKPGRPLAFGDLGHALFFGLPGNPVSVMVTFYQFVQPALLQLMGTSASEYPVLRAHTTTLLKKRPGRVEYQRARLARDENGAYVVSATGDQGSGILSSMSNANCFIVLDMETGRVEAGSLVDVQPFFGIV